MDYFDCNKIVTETLTNRNQDPADITRFKSFVDNCSNEMFEKIGMGLLRNVIYYNKIHAVKYLINTKRYTPQMFEEKTFNNTNIFHTVSNHNRPEILLYLLKTEYITTSHVDALDDHDATPFDYICRFYSRDMTLIIVQEMINCGKITYRTFLNKNSFIDLSKFTTRQMMDLVLNSGIIPDEILTKTKSGSVPTVLFSNVQCKMNLLHLIKSGKITDKILNVQNADGLTFVEYAEQINDSAWNYELYKLLATISENEVYKKKLRNENQRVEVMKNAILNGRTLIYYFFGSHNIIDLSKIPSIPMMDMFLDTGFITVEILNRVVITDKTERKWFNYDVVDRIHTVVTHNINSQVLLLHLLKTGKIEQSTVEANCGNYFTFVTEAYKNPLNASWVNEIMDCDVITCEFAKFICVPTDGESKHKGHYPSVVYEHPKHYGKIVDLNAEPKPLPTVQVENNTDDEIKILENKRELLLISIELIKCEIKLFKLTNNME